jgi:hypothetical protein
MLIIRSGNVADSPVTDEANALLVEKNPSHAVS